MQKYSAQTQVARYLFEDESWIRESKVSRTALRISRSKGEHPQAKFALTILVHYVDLRFQ